MRQQRNEKKNDMKQQNEKLFCAISHMSEQILSTLWDLHCYRCHDSLMYVVLTMHFSGFWSWVFDDFDDFNQIPMSFSFKLTWITCKSCHDNNALIIIIIIISTVDAICSSSSALTKSSSHPSLPPSSLPSSFITIIIIDGHRHQWRKPRTYALKQLKSAYERDVFSLMLDVL